ncbi:hypothetical protein Ahy_A01g003348 [Arachis hypogaea]|uniref:Protein FAR1-RELATED SEQUENCE n=1 Tax=Arachis hypogaea TaxID=3818 RepID=A0A445ESQ8_ARAHY|nr:hypothetical protein Ahy_A01g003348 [Arachis hypogaea]
MHNLNEVVRQYRTNELLYDFKSLFSSSVLTTCFEDIEKDAANIFTQNMFKEVKNEIIEASKLNVVSHSNNGNKIEVRMNKYQESGIEYEVWYDRSNNNLTCDCRLFESRGIPCFHIFCTMRHDHISTIPNTLIHKRWTKDLRILNLKRLLVSDNYNEKLPSTANLVGDPSVVKTKGAPRQTTKAAKALIRFIGVQNYMVENAH